MSKTISAMGLLNLLHKSANADINLLASEIRLLSVLITYINKDKDGYEAWPNTDTLTYKSGLSERTLERAKKSLVQDGWITIQSGKRGGKSNHYFINAKKIVEEYNKSNPKHSGTVPEALSRPSQPHTNRADNSSNLRVGAAKAEPPFKKMWEGTWYYSERDYDEAVEQTENSPF